MDKPQQIELTVTPSDHHLRLDKFLHHHLPDRSRSYWQKLIEQGRVDVGGKVPRASYRVTAGETVRIIIPPPQETNLLPEDIPLDILYEDEHLLVVNKPAGMVVHPGAGVRKGTLVNALLFHCRNHLSGVGGRLRPGIVHRLDKDTSGLLVVAKNDAAHLSLSRQFSEKTAHREYLTLVWHRLKDEEGEIETRLNRSKRDRTLFAVAAEGKSAVTQYRVEQRFRFLTLLRVWLKTGRTHQIRVHFSHIHHPVFGDPQYHGRLKQIGQLPGKAERELARKLLEIIPRQALHARKLSFRHPISNRKMEFQAPLPPDFEHLLRVLQKWEKQQK